MPMPSTTVFAFCTLIVLSIAYTPGVNSRFLPLFSCLLMVCTESPGLATKNLDSRMPRPGVGPFAHDAPVELVRGDGTNTLYRPAESR